MPDPALFKRSKLSPAQLDVARRLRAERKKEGFSLAELARECELTKSSLAAYEYGLAPLSLEAGDRLCARLNLNQRWLATGKVPERPFADALDLSASGDQIKDARKLDFHGAYTAPLRAAMEVWHKAHPMERIVEENIKAGLPAAVRRMSRSRLEAFAAEQFSFLRRTPDEMKLAYLRLFRGVILEELERRYSQNKKIEVMSPMGYPSPMQIAERLTACRKRLGLTQREAAEKWGVPMNTLRKWEQGQRRPRGLALRQLETILRDESQPSG